jgi:membrane protease YdiL (CAAX protease family)
MLNRFFVPILAVVIAIVVCSTLDANGLTNVSALALFPVLIVAWMIFRYPLRDMGLVWGRSADYKRAVMYPVLAIGVGTLIAFASRATDVSHAHWRSAVINFAIFIVTGAILSLITEEGFFRGWLWASLERAGVSSRGIIVATSIAFALWHISLVTLAKGFTLPPQQAALYILNVAFIGVIWGSMRSSSRSIIVTGVSHTLWNALTYVLYGIGPLSGLLGIKQTFIYGPEVGVIGLLINVVAAVILFLRIAQATTRNTVAG